MEDLYVYLMFSNAYAQFMIYFDSFKSPVYFELDLSILYCVSDCKSLLRSTLEGDCFKVLFLKDFEIQSFIVP